jgi:hypothetical protein
MSPTVATRAGSKAFPLTRMRAEPRCAGDYTPARQPCAIWHEHAQPQLAERLHSGYSATLGRPANAASISDCGCS